MKKNANTKNALSNSAKNKIIIFSLVGALLLGAIIIAIFAIVDYVKRDPNFDYLKSDLDKYVYLAESDYRDYEIELDIAKPHDIDVDVVMLNLLASNVKKDTEDTENDETFTYSDMVLGPADVVYIYYRGYLKDKDGNTVEASGMCNYSSASAASLTLGSGQFVPGFELGIAGKNIDDFPTFEKIKTGKVTDDMVVYVSYTRTPKGSTSDSDKVVVSNARVDLADSLDSLGKDFKSHIVGAEIGVAKNITDVTIGTKTYDYKNFKIEFATKCEKPSTNGGKPIQIIKCYFPYDYGQKQLRNETAYFEVYIEKAQDYAAPVLDDEFIKVVVGKEESPVKESDLAKYEGANLVEKYKNYVKEYLYDLYEEEYRSMVEDAMWEHYLSKAEFKKYPGVKVKPIYDEYVQDVYDQFEYTGGQIQNSLTGQYEIYEDIDSFAIAYLKLTYSENQDWKDVLYKISESFVGERLILYYLIEKLNIEITDEQLQATVDEIKEEYLDEYIKQSLAYEKIEDPDFKTPTGDDYTKYVEEIARELFGYYDDAYFTETAYYEIALDVFLTLPKVKTFDNGRVAYPYPNN